MINPMISVIVPIYNAEKYLDKCIDSIVNQTYKNLEIILVDDGSPDHCPSICDKWAEKDSRIKVIHKENEGVSKARNTALDCMNGSYATFIDSDDFVSPDMLETMLTEALKEAADMVICGFNFVFYDTGKTEKVFCAEKLYTDNQILNSYISDDIRPEACAKLINRDVINHIRFDEGVGYAEDLLFNYYVLKQCKAVKCIEECLYYYVQSSGNSSTTAYMTDDRAKSYNVTNIIVEDMRNSDLYNVAVWRHVRTLYALISRVIKSNDNYFYDTYFNDMKNEILKYKKSVIFGNMYTLKQKTATLLLSLSPVLFLKIMRRL